MRNKNILIGGLMAIVVVMAVGYAAFATQLNVNGTANITSSWKVAFDTTKTSAYTATTGLTGATAPTGTITFGNDQTATLVANLNQPGDKIVFTLTVKNTGTLKAKLGAPTLTGTSCTVNGLTCTSTSGHIKFTVTNPSPTSLAAKTGTSTITVTAEYPNTTISSASTESASLKVSLNASQDTAA